VVVGLIDRALTLPASSEGHRYYLCKRALDIVGASMLLVLSMPLLICIALLIRLDSPGPILYIQERVGSRRRKKDGVVSWQIRTFSCLKFRSMYFNADQSAHQAYISRFCNGKCGQASTIFKLMNDPRVTRIGHLLRRTSLDELPQLINVLIGDMSLVGPRPVPVYEAAHYGEAHLERLAALPGLTGPWQVKGRCAVPFEQMIEMDIQYTHCCSMWVDLKLLLATIPAVLSGRGAE
jgi:lipopolysaccharide/colanic/teichoic acid biosynthesis glycosyltransferase